MELKQRFALGVMSAACAFAVAQLAFNRGDNVAEMPSFVDDTTYVFGNLQTSQDSLDAQNRAAIEINKILNEHKNNEVKPEQKTKHWITGD